ncbi:hypothetical protein GLUCOINTEAF2_0201419 [Komagataeibacter intermedius AF2]|uniref:Uncharacterized protein n=1 Tax=Komagataeibacter intermedius AF2 TaxID=1458464 RepID=A0A0N1FEE5_9PROT|nr:hypothetical protein GLUCOINTEAF2_0201419 [Komagataeibacter intermedius AF2]
MAECRLVALPRMDSGNISAPSSQPTTWMPPALNTMNSSMKAMISQLPMLPGCGCSRNMMPRPIRLSTLPGPMTSTSLRRPMRSTMFDPSTVMTR